MVVFLLGLTTRIPCVKKLDRILMTKEWEDIFPQAMVKKLPREISYHNPLILSSGFCDKVPFVQFKFDLYWLKNPDFYQRVEKYGINCAELDQLLTKFSIN